MTKLLPVDRYRQNPKCRCSIPSSARWDALKVVVPFVLFTIALQQYCITSWTINHPLTPRQQQQQQQDTATYQSDRMQNINTYRKTSLVLYDVNVQEVEMNQPDNASISTTPTTPTSSTERDDDDDDDDDEYEYVDFDSLTEEEFIGSEWIVGTNWDKNPKKIDETWTRLIVDKDGKNIAVWGDDSKGTWTFDVPSQFLSISKENLFAGKKIWACAISDYYFLQGTVRGWTYWSAAAVIGQWQAKRLGVDKEETGTAPWFMTSEELATVSEDSTNSDDEVTDLMNAI